MGEATAKMLGEESKDMKQRKERSWSDLPPELLQLISSYLFAGDLGMFRGVCKSWQSVNAIRTLPPPPLPHPQRCPYLLSLMDNGTCRLFHPLYKGFNQVDFPELFDARIRYSKDGWLLLTQDYSILFLNPFTKQKKQLPDDPEGFATMCFSSPPTSSNWFVIGIDRTCFGIIKCGEERWTVHQLHLEERYSLSQCHPILYKGDCYIMGSLGQLWMFNHSNTGGSLGAILRKNLPFGNYVRGFMVESDGVLAVIDVLYREEKEEKQVSVSMLNLKTLEWKERNRRLKLSDKMVYASFASSFVGKAQVRGTNNKVYFPRIVENSCLFYSLDTKTYSTFQANYSEEIPTGTKYLPNSTWIYPNLELLKL